MLGCSVAFLAGEADALPPGLEEEYEILRQQWLVRSVTDMRANDLATAGLSNGMVFEATARLRQAQPDLSELELEARALAEVRPRLQTMRRVRMGNAVVQYPPIDDDERNALDAIDAEAVSIARDIGKATGRGNAPADSDLLLALQDLLGVRFWRALLRVGRSEVTEADSAAFAGAMGDVIRMALKPYLTGKERPTLIALPELRNALGTLRDAGIIAATNGESRHAP